MTEPERPSWLGGPTVAKTENKKVAILGGGVGAMVTAFELTDQPGWKEHYDITVYQLGWRLGGKGASGRNHKNNQRIEEHGLHLWFGFYENAFSVMRRCYQELGRSPRSPLATIDDAFKPYPFLGVMERLSSKLVPRPGAETPVDYDRVTEWAKFIEEWATNSDKPGTGAPGMDPWQLVGKLVTLALHAFSTMPFGPARASVPVAPGAPPATAGAPPRSVSARAKADLAAAAVLAHRPVRKLATLLARRAGRPVRSIVGGSWMAHLHLVNAKELVAEGAHHASIVVDILDAVRAFVWDEIGAFAEHDVVARRSWVLLDLAVALALGIVKDDVLGRGWDAIDGYDLREWLDRWGANYVTINHGIVTGCYDFVFAYEDGHANRKNLAAGAILRFMTRMIFEYRGSLAWTMEAGMGDTVFAPLYEVLKRRGVKFEFFHDVKKIGVRDGKVATIEVHRQVTLRDGGEYHPLIHVKGLPCWPSEPKYPQIVDGEKLEAGWTTDNYNLESHWTAWPKDRGETRTLHQGPKRDFDIVVLGISLGALREICVELCNEKQEWQDLVEKVPTVQTLAMQLWLRPPLKGLGWEGPPAVVDAYAWPHTTYADFSHLIPREDWTLGPEYPGSLAYFCGALEDEDTPVPAPSDHSFPSRQLRKVTKKSQHWLERNPTTLWPLAGDSDAPRALNYDLLVDRLDRHGGARLHGQFLRANIDPSERYVLSTKGSTKYRLHPAESGYDNLFLAGDWTWTPLNTGCVEAATMSGMLAARAIGSREKAEISTQYIGGEIHATKRGGLVRLRGPDRVPDFFAAEVPSEPTFDGKLSAIELTGQYDGAVAILELPARQVEELLPHGFGLAAHDAKQRGDTHPVVVTCGTRSDSGLTFPKLLLGQSYGELVIAVPFVTRVSRRSKGCSEDRFLYVPKLFVDSKVMAVGGRLLGLDIEIADIRRDVGSIHQGACWRARRTWTGTPIATLAPQRLGTSRPLSAFKSFHLVAALLSQPILWRSRGGWTVHAAMDWNLGVAMAAPARVDVRFGPGLPFVSLPAHRQTWALDEETSGATLGSFVLTRSNWRLSTPRLGRRARLLRRGPKS